MKTMFTILIALIFLTSCDSYQKISGTVFDKETGKPLNGVTVFNKNKNWYKAITDTTGNFELSEISSGFKRSTFVIVFEKENYKNFETSNLAGEYQIIKLEKIKQ